MRKARKFHELSYDEVETLKNKSQRTKKSSISEGPSYFNFQRFRENKAKQ